MSILVHEISKHYGSQVALDRVSFEIHPGEIVGFLGPNGAGKSTLMKILTGYLLPSAGRAEICGMEVSARPLEVKRQIGYLPEHNPLYTDMYVKEYLAMVAGIHRMGKAHKEIARMIEWTGLGNEQHKKIEALSKGYRQRVGLAQALLPNPKVLIFDEPTTGLDPNQILEIRNLIQSVAREKTIMLSTHIMQEVEAICSQIILIHQGKVVTQGSPRQLKESPGFRAPVEVLFDREVPIEKLGSLHKVLSVQQSERGTYLLHHSPNDDIRPSVFHLAAKEGWVLLEMVQRENPLEEIFRQLTQGAKN